ncbi:MAG: hypothetical protein RJQ10_07315 [Haliea sp.]|uniref:SMP-30/gluconolactonase/LRE family protein n=1 Tax=Haliea sp. TaxID=1932666 RepID=UPI0032EE4CAC
MRITPLLALVLPALLLGAPSALAAAVPCDEVDGIRSICGLAAPEDLVPAPNGRDLIFGQMAEPGGLWLLDTRDDSVHALLPAGPVLAPEELWGDEGCDQPTSWLGAHGLDLRQRADGRWQLLVVNHTERESVEFFELLDADTGRPRAVWRGCAVAPEEGNLNDVIGLADGSLLVTHMAHRRWPLWSAVQAAFGRDTGFVYRWRPRSGFVPVPGTGGAHPNGILLAPDEQSFYLNVYFGGSVRRHAVDSGALLAEVAVEKPDNASWANDGSLLVASHQANLWQLFRSLQQDHGAPSLLPFTVVAIDPATMVARPLLQLEGPPMGAGTVALQRGNDLYIGSYVGDRIIRLPMPGAASE